MSTEPIPSQQPSLKAEGLICSLPWGFAVLCLLVPSQSLASSYTMLGKDWRWDAEEGCCAAQLFSLTWVLLS